jgi:S1-C subfamily serine protease
MGTWSARTAFAGIVLSIVTIAACGGGNKPVTSATAPKASATAPPDPKVAEVHERISAHMCPAKNKLAELLGHKEGASPPAPAPEQAADSAPPPPASTDGSSKIAANQAYRVVAPSTVLIRSDRGMGTGVVIDPKGYILTNYHVVADGRKKDFIISVNVTFGDLSPTGRMTRQEKTYEAEVVKGDMIRDMAIIKVKGELPAKIQAVKLAKSAPQVAEKVIAVGHAGIGFLWAAKSCSIASVGERQQDTSRLAAYNCDNPDPALSPSEAKAFKERCTESKKAMTEALNSATQGLAIQSDCAITHGDSGGPLVNGAGELVGLNQSISADLATASFHVHLDEIREFTGKYPDQGIAILPDPFCDGGSNTTFEDIDLDGIPETIVSKGSSGFLGYDRMSLIIDLDQNRIVKKNEKSAKDTVETFDGEIALLTVRDTTYVWYDTDDDSKFDLLLVDKNNDGVPEQAYRIDKDGHPKEDKEALPKHDLSAKYVKDAKLHARLGKIATAIGGTKFVSSKILTAAKSETKTPDPILGGGTQGRALDTDGDGKPDVAVMRGTFSRGILIDADEDSLGSLKSGDAVDDLVKNKKIDPEVSIVVQANAVWAMYDTDNDGKMDLALMTVNGTDPSSLYATGAWKLSGGGEMTPAPEHIGRKLLRPGLMTSFPRIAKAFALISSDVATDEGLGSLPDPYLAGKARFRGRDLKGIPSATMIEATTFNASTILIDVDHDTKIPKDPKAKPEPPKKPDPAAKKDPKDPKADKDKDIPKDAVSDEDIQKILTDKKYDAEVAVVHKSGADGGSDWIYYDTDNDGKFDLVLFVATSGKEPTQAWRIKPMQEKLELDASAAAGKPYRHKTIFKDKAMGPKFKKIAAAAFRSSSVEE